MSASIPNAPPDPAPLASFTVTMTQVVTQSRTMHVMASNTTGADRAALAALAGLGQYNAPDGVGIVTDLGAGWVISKVSTSYANTLG